MPRLPKLRVKTIPGYPDGEVCDFEQVRDLAFRDVSVFVEGYRVNSYDELVQLAAQESYRDQKFLEVMILCDALPDGG